MISILFRRFFVAFPQPSVILIGVPIASVSGRFVPNENRAATPFD
jgi:hypothetical protein